MKTKRTSLFIILIAAVVWLSPVKSAEASNVTMPAQIHEKVVETDIGPGVVHESRQRFTASGWWNINVIRIDLTNEYNSLGSLYNPLGVSNRDSISAMVEKNGAIAGINGDFYNYTPVPNSLGALIDNGKIISSPNKLPIFYLEDQEAFIDYFTTNMSLTNWRTAYQMPVMSINKVSNNFDTIMLFNSDWGEKSIGNRFHPDLTEFLVIDGMVVEKRTNGEPFTIPKDDSAFVMASRSSHVNNFEPGDRVILEISITPNHENLQFAISAGGMILIDGQPSNTDVVVAGNHPRTGMGISKRGDEVILVTIDGRDTYFQGVSQEMFGSIMRDLGAWNAVNLDGGGSTTMALKPSGESKATVVNKPSEGTQRLVVNGVGVFSSAPYGKPAYINVTADKDSLFTGESAKLNVKIYDRNHNLLSSNPSGIKWSVSRNSGSVSGGNFFADEAGIAKLDASYEGATGTIELRVLSQPEEIITTSDRINVAPGGTASLGILKGVSSGGYTGNLSYSNVKIETVGGIGEVRDGVLYASKNPGSGSIFIRSGNAVKTIYVSVGTQIMFVSSFENESEFSFSGYPAAVEGYVAASKEAIDGNRSIELGYDFSFGTGTRAAYIDFNTTPDGIPLPGSPSKISLWAYGDESGAWLRGTIIDAQNKSHTIDFAKTIDFVDWKQLEASISTDVTFPISLKRVYVAEVDESKQTVGNILIDNLSVFTPTPYDYSIVPQNTKVNDPLNANTSSNNGSYKMTVYSEPVISGNTLFARVVSTDRLVGLTQRLSGSDLGIQIGNMTQNFKSALIHSKTMTAGSTYGVERNRNLAVITLQAGSGGLRTQDSSQWTRLVQELEYGTEDNLVLIINRPISTFTDTMEAELFRELVAQAAEDGRNIFVVQSGSKNDSQLRDSVRYIELTGTKASKPDDLSSYSYFELVLDGRNVSYQVVRPFSLNN